VFAFVLAACAAEDDQSEQTDDSDLTQTDRRSRYARLRDAFAAHGIRGKAYLFAAIAMNETGLAHCWSEATWACQGPSSPDCGGGPVIAGASDGPCSQQQGGLGMFQFDGGNFQNTLARYGKRVLTLDGQAALAVEYVVNMVKISAYTTNAETDEKALAWINAFDVGNRTLRDQWIQTVLRYYNGCQPNWDCWWPRLSAYDENLSLVLRETGGTGFWASGTTCNGGSGTTIGAIDAKYVELGGCGSFIGAPITDERWTPDTVGRYSVFERGSIYWKHETGAHEVHGGIRDKWRDLGWEPGVLGYPITDETGTPDGIGRYNVFELGSIYWTKKTGAHEVLGRIRDKWKELGWEAGALGYPVSGEYDVSGGRRSDFERGSITWKAATDSFAVAMTRKKKPAKGD
jgi:hypothetical protein